MEGITVGDPPGFRWQPFAWHSDYRKVGESGTHGVPVGKYKIHGRCKLPDGYALLFSPYNTVVTPLTPDSAECPGAAEPPDAAQGRNSAAPAEAVEPPVSVDGYEQPSLSCSYNILRGMVGVFQSLSASVAVYRARGDQISRYGYAAFGLTVIPYGVMSVVNLLGGLLTLDYDVIYTLWSPEMNEAKSRGGYFEGVVGKVSPDTDNSGEEALLEKSGNNVSITIPANPPPRTEASETTEEPETMLFIPRCCAFKCEEQYPPRFLIIVLLFLHFVPIPFLIIYALTRFNAGNSTFEQRFWTMAWIAAGSRPQLVMYSRGALLSAQSVG
jgi:hypothetical protein